MNPSSHRPELPAAPSLGNPLQKQLSTQLAFIGMRLLCTPCWCLLSMLVFILYKQLHPSALQIAVLLALKPASSLLSPYWSHAIYQRPDKILSNLKGANLLRHLPLLLMPWIDSIWFIIAAFGLYMTLTRATIPTWMEMFKHTLPQAKQVQMVGYGTTIDYLGTAFLTVGAGFLLDRYSELWRWFFSLTALSGILSTLLLSQIALPLPLTRSHSMHRSIALKKQLVRPWKHVYQLLRAHPGFARFQIGFMLCGGGLMLMQPVLPKLFIDEFNLSFVEMSLAIAFCKGFGVACTSSLWTRLFHRCPIFTFSGFVALFATLFPFLLLATSWHLAWFYIAYIFYGIMQGGSELSWHMSGLTFGREKESSLFSTTNVLTVGVRGCVIPLIGSLLAAQLSPMSILLMGALLCLLAALHFLFKSAKIGLRATLSDR